MRTRFRPIYTNSWALVIGINEYRNASRLQFARSDAEAVAEVLTQRFRFPESNVTLLSDGEATREAILAAFCSFSGDKVQEDDRILFFFAGHGHTITGVRRDVGFLVPFDGDAEKVHTLIRWDELTGDAELIRAKHLLFVMDACYGGLALTRSLPPGSTRYVKDMLSRYSRQVITAGKGDEVVSDMGGPRPNHSPFTGHLLVGLESAARDADGIVTANWLMSYVHEKVSRDTASRQTPHFGYLDGDGDFFFDTGSLDLASNDSPVDQDYPIQVPITLDSSWHGEPANDLETSVKEYLSDQRYRIRLDDLAVFHIRKFRSLTSEDELPVNETPQDSAGQREEILRRLNLYGSSVCDLQTIITLLCSWGTSDHVATITRIMSRSSEICSGYTTWHALRWFPTVLLMYSGGIAAFASHNYANPAAVLLTEAGTTPATYGQKESILVASEEAMLELNRANVFQILPGYERKYAPLSEWLFKVLQPALDDLLFLGTSYESLFDQYEVFSALAYVAEDKTRPDRIWARLGRFAWKYRNKELGTDPFSSLIAQVRSERDSWAALGAGFFNGSFARFDEIATDFEQFIAGSVQR